MKKELITKIDPKSPVSEVFRALRTNIQYMGKGGKSQSMVVTSTMQGEGKSWVISNLAVTFAQAGKNVILIDADMRRPRQNNIFGVDMYPGLSNYLSGVTSRGTERDITVRDCIQPTEIDNLYIIPAGNIPPNPSELLASPKMKELVDELKKIFDIVIFDGAPCLIVTDSTVISRVVDYTLLVASQKTTKIDDLKDAKKQIEAVGGHVIGVVLNRVKMSSKKYENKYYYTQNADGTRKRVRHHEHTISDDDYMDSKSSKNSSYSERKSSVNEDNYNTIRSSYNGQSNYNDKQFYSNNNAQSGSDYSNSQSQASNYSSNQPQSVTNYDRGQSVADSTDKINFDEEKIHDIINQIKGYSERKNEE